MASSLTATELRRAGIKSRSVFSFKTHSKILRSSLRLPGSPSEVTSRCRCHRVVSGVVNVVECFSQIDAYTQSRASGSLKSGSSGQRLTFCREKITEEIASRKSIFPKITSPTYLNYDIQMSFFSQTTQSHVNWEVIVANYQSLVAAKTNALLKKTEKSSANSEWERQCCHLIWSSSAAISIPLCWLWLPV